MEVVAISKTRIEREKEIVEKMIRIYCRGHKHGPYICPECKELIHYSQSKLERCKFGNKKVFCSKCRIHCYNPKMREKIRKIMRYSGPKMIFYSPVIAIKHFLHEK